LVVRPPTQVIAMDRDYALFPNDDNGNVLWHLRSRGDALTQPREIDVTAILPSESAAVELATACLRRRFKVEMYKTEQSHDDKLDWEVIVYAMAIPTHEAVSALERELGSLAASLGGRVSGWSTSIVRSA
jgi:hypothetical protein